MRTLLILATAAALAAAGCATKGHVADEISASEARTAAELGTVKSANDQNAAEIARLQQLSQELGEKADMALNRAKGFENYQVIWSGQVNFGFDSYEVDGIAAAILDEAGMKMESVPASLLEVSGHTDQTGPANYNIMLGQMRAEAAKRYLVDKFGISLYRMFTVSHGENKPVAMPDERNGNAKNRRVMLSLWGPM